VVEDGGLDAATEQSVRLAHEVLVERVFGGDQQCEPVAAAAARPHCCRSEATVPGKPTEMAQSRRPMSMPSSSASVAATPSSSPSTRRRSMSPPLLGRVAGAVRREPLRRRGLDASPVKRWMSSALRRLFAKQIVRSRVRRAPRRAGRLADRGRALSELLVEQRRVPERDRSAPRAVPRRRRRR
jgi:hypothetical protein